MLRNFILFFIFVIYLTVDVNAKNTNKIIVKIDNELITSYDIKNKILTTLVLAQKEINQKNIDILKSKSIEDLIQNRLKKIELKKYNLKRNDKKITAYLNSISSNNIQNLKLIFRSNQIDYTTFVDEIDVELKWRAFIYNNFSKKIEINLDEIDKEIEKIAKKKVDLLKYNLSEIEITSNNDGTDKKKITEILNEINNSSFEDAVIKFSISPTSTNKGQLGWINSNSISNDLRQILSKMRIGEISKPIIKNDKITFLKLNDKKKSNLSKINKDTLTRNN